MQYTFYFHIFARYLSLCCECHTHCILIYLRGIWLSVVDELHISHICEVSESLLSIPYKVYSHIFARYLSLWCQWDTHLTYLGGNWITVVNANTLCSHIFGRYLSLCCQCHTHCILTYLRGIWVSVVNELHISHICEVSESLLSMPYTLYSHIFGRYLSFRCQWDTHLTYLRGNWVSFVNAIHLVFSHISEVSESVLSMPYTLYSHIKKNRRPGSSRFLSSSCRGQ